MAGLMQHLNLTARCPIFQIRQQSQCGFQEDDDHLIYEIGARFALELAERI